jgi:Flp pilus assembly protein TadG
VTPRRDRIATPTVRPEGEPRSVPPPGDACGQASVELALVLPLVALLLLGLLQAGVVLRDQLLVVQAAREGVREASVSPLTERIETAARQAAPALAAKGPVTPAPAPATTPKARTGSSTSGSGAA